jgi:hypothetical protein
MPLLSMTGHWLNRLLLAAKSHFGPWLKRWILVREDRKCFIFQWGLTDTLSAAALFSIVSDRSIRQ